MFHDPNQPILWLTGTVHAVLEHVAGWPGVQIPVRPDGVVLVGFKPDLDDQLVSFIALTLVV